ncbi:MAG TPA: class I adenylate-forming enzyme family protein [Solirubrobacterales bacterium]|nr:class I adenylate-forming enzyme family protein [Solirubrobacterales bacterium]
MFTSPEALPGGLSELAREIAERRPEMRFLDSKEPITAAEFLARMEAVAGGLWEWGVRPGDRVAISMRNSMAWLEVWFAVAHVGAVLVPLNTRFAPAEAEFVLRHSKASWVILAEGHAPLDLEALTAIEAGGEAFRGCALVGVDPAAPNQVRLTELVGDPVPCQEDGEALGMVQYTSGSTAFPKGAMLRNHGLLRNGHGLGVGWQLDPEADHAIVSNPLFHCGGTVFAFLAAYTHGVDVTLVDAWRVEEAWEMIERQGITIAPVIDAAARDLLSYAHATGRRLPSLRLVSTAADPELFAAIAAELGCEISNVFGLTESSPNVCVGDLADPLQVRLDHTGRVQPGLTVAIRDPDSEEILPDGTLGEITTKGWALMLGYLDDPEATAAATTADGCLRTGDLGTLEGDLLTYRGRAKLMIKSGGENISIEEVEAALRTHPDLADAIVVPIPDPRFSEVGYAYLRPHDGAAPDADEILEHCRTRIARFKVPKRAEIITDLPTSGSGKIDRRTLTDRARETVAAG